MCTRLCPSVHSIFGLQPIRFVAMRMLRDGIPSSAPDHEVTQQSSTNFSLYCSRYPAPAILVLPASGFQTKSTFPPTFIADYSGHRTSYGYWLFSDCLIHPTPPSDVILLIAHGSRTQYTRNVSLIFLMVSDCICYVLCWVAIMSILLCHSGGFGVSPGFLRMPPEPLEPPPNKQQMQSLTINKMNQTWRVGVRQPCASKANDA